MQLVSRLRTIEKRVNELSGDNLPLLKVRDYTRMSPDEIASIPPSSEIVKNFTNGGTIK